MKRLRRDFFERDTVVVAFELIGKILRFHKGSSKLSGMIVETEAYLGLEDPASHAYRGPTPRTRVMFGPAGFTYVYFTYGNHHCMNVVTEKDRKAGAVLIRALEPIDGIEQMKKHRRSLDLLSLTSGPGKLTQALGIGREHSGLDLDSSHSEIFLTEEAFSRDQRIQAATRIGISRAKELPYRFYAFGNVHVSKRVA